MTNEPSILTQRNDTSDKEFADFRKHYVDFFVKEKQISYAVCSIPFLADVNLIQSSQKLLHKRQGTTEDYYVCPPVHWIYLRREIIAIIR